MSAIKDLIQWVEELEAASLSRTALSVLAAAEAQGQVYGDRAFCVRHRLLQKVEIPRIVPAVYILTFDRVGVPLRIEARAGSLCDPSLRPDAVAAWFDAQKSARGILPPGSAIFTTTVPIIRPMRSLDGSSLGLGAAISILAYLTGRNPLVPVLCTGTIGPDGHIGPVRHLPQKVSAALAELEGTSGRVLVCADQATELPSVEAVIPVRTLEEACRIVFGDSVLFPQDKLIYLEDRLREIARIPDHTEAMRQLSMIPLENYNRTDQARILLHLGSRSRHMGNPGKAAEFHDRWQRLSADVRIELGEGVLETMETEVIATELDHFRLDEMESMLRLRLQRPAHLVHNAVRYRGMLAQVLTMGGRHGEAVKLRVENLAIQDEGGENLRLEIPRTLSYAVFEAARDGNADAFEVFRARLLRETRLFDENQHRYNALNILRGLVLLGRLEEATRWIAGGEDPPSQRILALRETVVPVSLHPEATILRTLARLLRKTGQAEKAASLCDLVNVERMDPMAAWYGATAMAEKGLCLLSLQRVSEAQTVLATTADFLRQIYTPLAEHHVDFIALLRADEPDVTAIESALDQLYY